MEKKFLEEVREGKLNESMYTQDDLKDLINEAKNHEYVVNIEFSTSINGVTRIKNNNGRITLKAKAYLDETFNLNILKREFLEKIKENKLTLQSYCKNDLEDLINWGERSGYIDGIIYSKALNGNHCVSTARLTRRGKFFLIA